MQISCILSISVPIGERQNGTASPLNHARTRFSVLRKCAENDEHVVGWLELKQVHVGVSVRKCDKVCRTNWQGI